MRSTRVSLMLCGVLAGAPAIAGTDVHLGVAVGMVADAGDAASAGNTRLVPGPSLAVPVRITLLDVVRVRFDLRYEMGLGRDELTWNETIDGAIVRRSDADGHAAFVGVLGAEAGIDAIVPVAGRVRPYFGATVGVAGVGAYHSLREDTAVLLDPELNDPEDPRNIDPYTLQAVAGVSGAAGVTWRAQERLDLCFEMGYGSAFVASRALRKSPSELDARREAFAWNPFRVSVGVLFKL